MFQDYGVTNSFFNIEYRFVNYSNFKDDFSIKGSAIGGGIKPNFMWFLWKSFFYKLEISHDGQNYFGWQIQKKTELTIQGKLNKAFLEATKYY